MDGSEKGPRGCTLYRGGLQALLRLRDDQAGRAIKEAVIYFLFREEVDDADQAVSIVGEMLREDVRLGLERYAATCARNRANRLRERAEDPGNPNAVYVLPK